MRTSTHGSGTVLRRKVKPINLNLVEENMASVRALSFAVRRFATTSALPAVTRAARTSFPAFASSPARGLAIGVSSASYLTPGFKPQ